MGVGGPQSHHSHCHPHPAQPDPLPSRRRQSPHHRLQTDRCCQPTAWVPLGGCHPRGVPLQVSFTWGWCPCAGAVLWVSPALSHCPCPAVPAVPPQVSRGVPAWSLSRWGCLSPGVPPRLSRCGCPCLSPARAGCLRVSLSLSASGLCPCAGPPPAVPPAVPWPADREGQSPVPTSQGITRGSAQLCLIRGLQGLGLARGRGATQGCPSRTRHAAAEDIRGGSPAASTSTAGFDVSPNTSPQGGTGGGGKQTSWPKGSSLLG